MPKSDIRKDVQKALFEKTRVRTGGGAKVSTTS